MRGPDLPPETGLAGDIASVLDGVAGIVVADARNLFYGSQRSKPVACGYLSPGGMAPGMLPHRHQSSEAILTAEALHLIEARRLGPFCGD